MSTPVFGRSMNLDELSVTYLFHVNTMLGKLNFVDTNRKMLRGVYLIVFTFGLVDYVI